MAASVQFLLLAIASVQTAFSDAEADPAKSPANVVLSMTAPHLDPFAAGEHRVKCTIKNTSDKPLRVPTIYTAGFDADMSLIASGRHPLDLVFWGGPKSQKWKSLEPGKELVVFEESLRAILLLDFKEENAKALIPGRARYYWNWRA